MYIFGVAIAQEMLQTKNSSVFICLVRIIDDLKYIQYLLEPIFQKNDLCQKCFIKWLTPNM